ncbi:hypothetical protein LTR37_000773 [Vermiconidia calcicola]|uniref:Uncharacterized protein n=1 Tax=Vermiconidia calcicola TaxID=1690605 RepID=A0ACC3NWQ1_9PEZI|nr:hypothetical protein LTR37_000773 [Vermiconidia calcicola]
MASTTDPQNSTPTLKSIPRELRDLIYNEIGLPTKLTDLSPGSTVLPILVLGQTCRQLHEEIEQSLFKKPLHAEFDVALRYPDRPTSEAIARHISGQRHFKGPLKLDIEAHNFMRATLWGLACWLAFWAQPRKRLGVHIEPGVLKVRDSVLVMIIPPSGASVPEMGQRMLQILGGVGKGLSVERMECMGDCEFMSMVWRWIWVWEGDGTVIFEEASQLLLASGGRVWNAAGFGEATALQILNQ